MQPVHEKSRTPAAVTTTTTSARTAATAMMMTMATNDGDGGGRPMPYSISECQIVAPSWLVESG